jgi:hypothetical protein
MSKIEISPELKNKIDSAKSAGHSVYSLNVAGIKYYYRSINRSEFRSLQETLTTEAEAVKNRYDALKKGIPDKDPKIDQINIEFEKEANILKERGEERLIKTALLYPTISDNTPAGVLSTLADHIMLGSGYGNEEEPEVL